MAEPVVPLLTEAPLLALDELPMALAMPLEVRVLFEPLLVVVLPPLEVLAVAVECPGYEKAAR